MMMQVERLERLAEFLKTVKPEEFDISTWATAGFMEGCHECGTAACALGWATRVFKELKLNDGVPWLDTEDDSHVAYEIGPVFFGLTSKQTHHLFDPNDYGSPWQVTPLDVVERIEEMVAPFKIFRNREEVMRRGAILLITIHDYVKDSEGAWTDKRDAILKGATDAERESLEEFVSWFEEEEA